MKRKFFNWVYTTLVRVAGALESQREDFIAAHLDPKYPCQEWRFQGFLGFGGKYYAGGNRVSCYSEDLNPSRESIIEETNRELEGIAEAWGEQEYEIQQERQADAAFERSREDRGAGGF